MPRTTPALSIVFAALTVAGCTSALAFNCDGPFQITKEGRISSPYCEEEQIAKVAQSYGMKVTAAEVHNNPLKKVYLCQTIGYDIRLKGSCAGYGPDAIVPR